MYNKEQIRVKLHMLNLYKELVMPINDGIIQVF